MDGLPKPSDFFLLKSLPRRFKKMWLTVLDKGFWGSFFLMLVLCDLDLF